MQHINLTDSGLEKKEEHEDLTHVIEINKPKKEKVKPMFVDTATTIDRHKSILG